MSPVKTKLSHCVAYLELFSHSSEPKTIHLGHDRVLLKLFSFLRSFLEDEYVLYVDLPGKHASENLFSIVSVSILVTSARPDMVLIRNMVN